MKMNYSFTKEQLAALPATFTCTKARKNRIFLTQDVSDPTELANNLVYSIEHFAKTDQKSIQYLLEPTENGYELIELNRKNFFSWAKVNPETIARGTFELWRNLGISNEKIDRFNEIMEKFSQNHFPYEKDGFVLRNVANKFDIIHFLSGATPRIMLVSYNSPLVTLYAQLDIEGTIWTNHTSIQADLNELGDILLKQIHLHRLKLLVGN